MQNDADATSNLSNIIEVRLSLLLALHGINFTVSLEMPGFSVSLKTLFIDDCHLFANAR